MQKHLIRRKKDHQKLHLRPLLRCFFLRIYMKLWQLFRSDPGNPQLFDKNEKRLYVLLIFHQGGL